MTTYDPDTTSRTYYDDGTVEIKDINTGEVLYSGSASNVSEEPGAIVVNDNSSSSYSSNYSNSDDDDDDYDPEYDTSTSDLVSSGSIANNNTSNQVKNYIKLQGTDNSNYYYDETSHKLYDNTGNLVSFTLNPKQALKTIEQNHPGMIHTDNSGNITIHSFIEKTNTISQNNSNNTTISNSNNVIKPSDIKEAPSNLNLYSPVIPEQYYPTLKLGNGQSVQLAKPNLNLDIDSGNVYAVYPNDDKNSISVPVITTKDEYNSYLTKTNEVDTVRSIISNEISPVLGNQSNKVVNDAFNAMESIPITGQAIKSMETTGNILINLNDLDKMKTGAEEQFINDNKPITEASDTLINMGGTVGKELEKNGGFGILGIVDKNNYIGETIGKTVIKSAVYPATAIDIYEKDTLTNNNYNGIDSATMLGIGAAESTPSMITGAITNPNPDTISDIASMAIPLGGKSKPVFDIKTKSYTKYSKIQLLNYLPSDYFVKPLSTPNFITTIEETTTMVRNPLTDKTTLKTTTKTPTGTSTTVETFKPFKWSEKGNKIEGYDYTFNENSFSVRNYYDNDNLVRTTLIEDTPSGKTIQHLLPDGEITIQHTPEFKSLHISTTTERIQSVKTPDEKYFKSENLFNTFEAFKTPTEKAFKYYDKDLFYTEFEVYGKGRAKYAESKKDRMALISLDHPVKMPTNVKEVSSPKNKNIFKLEKGDNYDIDINAEPFLEKGISRIGDNPTGYIEGFTGKDYFYYEGAINSKKFSQYRFELDAVDVKPKSLIKKSKKTMTDRGKGGRANKKGGRANKNISLFDKFSTGKVGLKQKSQLNSFAKITLKDKTKPKTKTKAFTKPKKPKLKLTYTRTPVASVNLFNNMRLKPTSSPKLAYRLTNKELNIQTPKPDTQTKTKTILKQDTGLKIKLLQDTKPKNPQKNTTVPSTLTGDYLPYVPPTPPSSIPNSNIMPPFKIKKSSKSFNRSDIGLTSKIKKKSLKQVFTYRSLIQL